MDLELVRTFVAVVERGGVRRAATQLHRTQPAISARLRELQRQVGAPLFERAGRRLELTPAGQVLAQEAPALLAAEAALAERVQDVAARGRTRLRLATIDAASIYVLPALYGHFRTQSPSVQLLVQVVESRRVIELVAGREAEIGVLALPAAHQDLQVVPVFEEELVCVAAAAHPLAAHRTHTLRSLAAYPLVLYAHGSNTRAVLDAVFDAHGIVPDVAMETASPEAMKRLAEAGVGICILPETLVRDDVAAGRLSRLQTSDARFVRRLGTAVHRTRPLSPAARDFLALVHRNYPPLA